MADADAVLRRAVAAGAEVVVPAKDEERGGRGFSCRDPEGHLWNLGTYAPWRGRAAPARLGPGIAALRWHPRDRCGKVPHEMDGSQTRTEWDALLALRDPGTSAPAAARDAGGCPPPHGSLAALFGPLLAPSVAEDGCVVVGRLAQTLDGRIATLSGSSQWIGGRGDILHTHRLRALCHAVVVGAGTVRHDDPRLTTRECPGPDPVRVVLDAERRLGPGYRLFREEGPSTLLLCAEDAPPGPDRHGRAEVLRLPRDPAAGGLHLPALLRLLAGRGLTRLFVEGGGVTVSRFLAAGCLDRLHVTVAPVLLGSGIPAFTLPVAARVSDGLRFAWTPHALDQDVLFDIALGRARPGVCAA